MMNDCPHFTEPDQCRVIAQVAGLETIGKLTPQACAHCTRAGRPPRDINEVTVSLALYQWVTDKDRRKAIMAEHGHHLRREHRVISADRDLAASILSAPGPGTELWNLLQSLGVEHQPNCPCLRHAAQMNVWGPAGCREHHAEIVGWIRAGADRFGWSTAIGAAMRAVLTGLAFRISPVDPYGSLVDEAIRRAEIKTAA